MVLDTRIAGNWWMNLHERGGRTLNTCAWLYLPISKWCSYYYITSWGAFGDSASLARTLVLGIEAIPELLQLSGWPGGGYVAGLANWSNMTLSKTILELGGSRSSSEVTGRGHEFISTVSGMSKLTSLSEVVSLKFKK
jgi:hypothetical protein